MNTDNQGFLARQIGQRSNAIGQQVLDTAANIHRVADQLRNDAVTEKASELADVAAKTAETFGQYLQTTSLDTMLADAERFSRTRPWTVAFGSFIVGVSASRVIKAGAARRAYAGQST
jgi:hypothetical protein